jgi:hypothetical protein
MGLVACMRRDGKFIRSGNLKRPLGISSCVDGRITLKWILKIKDESMWTGVIWLRTGTSS